MPWYRAEFDLEGLAFGGLALALAILLGGLSWIFTLLFLIIMVIILLGSRDADRTSPEGSTLVLAPCDGVIESIANAEPPRELRWDAPEALRIRITSSPFSVNGMRSPITGNVESFLVEPGAPTALSYDPDNTEMKEAFILTSSEEGTIGLRLATGGFGPRMDIDLEAGDTVRAGRKIGVRRLGGWCDIYLPVGCQYSLTVGMSVIGGETILSDLAAQSGEKVSDIVEVEAEVMPETPEVSAIEMKPATPEKSAMAETEKVVADLPDVADLPEPEVLPVAEVSPVKAVRKKPAANKPASKKPAAKKPTSKTASKARTPKPKPRPEPEIKPEPDADKPS